MRRFPQSQNPHPALRKWFLEPLTCVFLVILSGEARCAEWPALFPRTSPPSGQTASAALPLPREADPAFLDALPDGGVRIGGTLVQAQPVGWYEGKSSPRRAILRWTGESLPETLDGEIQLGSSPGRDAGWSFAYKLVASSSGDPPWKSAIRNVPLEETSYEMYQLNLSHQGRELGLRLGLRHNDRLYWWQYVRADFVQRGPVFDLLRVGGPIYNEESSIQADVFLVLYANGLIEAYAHFINNQREGPGVEAHGIPVLAFDIPESGEVNHSVDGARTHFTLGGVRLNLSPSLGYVDKERPGSLRTEEGLVVWQPWLDQEVFGDILVEKAGIPEHRIDGGIGEAQQFVATRRGEVDRYWLAKIGDAAIPRGLARTVRFYLSLGNTPPEVIRYQAPGWWHSQCEALPTGNRHLPVDWWAIRRAREISASYHEADTGVTPFEAGRSGRDTDGTLGAALLMLGNLVGSPTHAERAPAVAYWWADIAVDHVDFTCHEIPKYSWQWIVQPYMRWMELVHVYWELGDPYLLETAKFVADAYYRFFWTNRPHRFVGRDSLGCADMLALYHATGERMHLDRTREILAEARRSYGQLEEYMPGHQSGVGPNGIARVPSFDYIPMLIARLHVQMIEAARGTLPGEEEEEAWKAIRMLAELVAEKVSKEGWTVRMTDLSYMVLTALADKYPEESDKWIGMLNRYNRDYDLPGKHDGGKAFSWMNSAIRLDAWAWGATWSRGTLHLRPRSILEDPRAPKTARVWTPKGWVELQFKDGKITPIGECSLEIKVESVN
ncbi:MAG: hypothetical protein HUU16_13430 [Candidatus Omnitrophica bacterium]|nr:hypothetical protein [Candidatus Omnitrophota bacterium]